MAGIWEAMTARLGSSGHPCHEREKVVLPEEAFLGGVKFPMAAVTNYYIDTWCLKQQKFILSQIW